MYENNQFFFLNEFGNLTDWNEPTKSKLWLYNLHYFDDLDSIDASSRYDQHNALIERWIIENPTNSGNGWEPYPLSLRIVNWIKWYLVNGILHENQLKSLILQTKVLSQSLEKHILGNHLFANAKALIFAGLFFEGAEADSWVQVSLDIFSDEIPEQILGDGGNFELSPMYHAIMVSDLLDILGIIDTFDDKRCEALAIKIRQLLPKMLRWLAVMSHPDSFISMFNDSALEVAPNIDQLITYAEKHDIYPSPVDHEYLNYNEDTGYFRLNLHEAVIIGDVGKVGPDYIPGHAHADTLSFELSVFNKRLIVNSGTSMYGMSTERLRQRGTKAHNTVTIDEENSSEVWSGFRVARRAKPFGLYIDEQAKVIRCSHDGYKRLFKNIIHTREWYYADNSLTIIDKLEGRFKSAEARFHLHPDWHYVYAKNLLLCEKNEHVVKIEISHGEAYLQPSTYHPTFGSSLDNMVLVVIASAGLIKVSISW